jgi:anti-repressor protein
VCNTLGIDSSQHRRLDEDEKSLMRLTHGTIIGNPNVTIINEAGLYTLILGSRKPEAKAFKRWITHEVIPSIRKTGGYQVQPIYTFRYLQIPS